jgi:hypothetical protein
MHQSPQKIATRPRGLDEEAERVERELERRMTRASAKPRRFTKDEEPPRNVRRERTEFRRLG